MAQKMGTIRFDDPNFERAPYSAFKAYAQSKLANIMFTYELARRLEGSGVCVNAVHPGVVGTGFARDYKGIAGWLVKLSKPFLRSSDKGAETVVWLASSPEAEGITGKYYSDKKPLKSIPLSYDVNACRQLWELSEKMVSGSK
jgi:NAD(P)-dependent dehydrogenase (short-subunit alcohol dehydrogenase family)